MKNKKYKATIILKSPDKEEFEDTLSRIEDECQLYARNKYKIRSTH